VIGGSVSWPVGFGGTFHPELTGAQNTRFVARMHGVDPPRLTEFVEDFAELGAISRCRCAPIRKGMKARLTFGMSMGIAFDTYLVDESHGDRRRRLSAPRATRFSVTGSGTGRRADREPQHG
jgi:capsular polysaccharide transport system ATP-binding protein